MVLVCEKWPLMVGYLFCFSIWKFSILHVLSPHEISIVDDVR
jgi:hypothetical protein